MATQEGHQPTSSALKVRKSLLSSGSLLLKPLLLGQLDLDFVHLLFLADLLASNILRRVLGTGDGDPLLGRVGHDVVIIGYIL